MSSYVVENETINKILAGTRTASWSDDLPRPREAITSESDFASYGYRMHEMNCDAVRDHYMPEDAAEMCANPYVYRQELPPTRIQLYKSIACFLYQCDEGEIPERRLYQDLQAWQHAIGNYIISDLEEYNKAKWE